MPGVLTYNALVLPFLRNAYGDAKNGAKRLARDAGVSPRTAENWLNGTCAPGGDSVLNLMIACPPLETVISETIASRRAALRREAAACVEHAERRLAARPRTASADLSPLARGFYPGGG